jgi:guanylate kinase
MSTGRLVILSAPSGTGKTSICKELRRRNKDWKFSISATTRPMREGEDEGVDYIFMDVHKFEHYVKFGDFIEWEWVHGNKYGTLIGPVEDAIDDGEVMMFEIDVKGAVSLMDEFPDNCLSIFIIPPGEDMEEQLESLEERLMKRGKESKTIIKRRLKRFALEIEYQDKFNHTVVNDDFETTVSKLEKIIKDIL